MDERDALVILNAIPGAGNISIRKWIDRYGSAAKVFSLGAEELAAVGRIPAKALENICHFPKDKFLKAEYNLMGKRGVRVVTWFDEDYPGMLREIPDAPVVLYVKGRLPVGDGPAIGLVGSRRSSFYGQTVAEKFASRFSELGFTVVSGMARGIDTAAHTGALRAGGITVAVLGSGLKHIYPLENKRLSDEVAGSGAVISEFPMDTRPLPCNFPRRNRIISGLSLGVVIVEAAQRSGALITADCALEQGREVFAVPGKIDHPSTQGVHSLIKQGAKLVTCVEDILEDLAPRIAAHLSNEIREGPASGREVRHETAPRQRLIALSDNERMIYESITDRPVHIDELTRRVGPAVPVMSVLLQLELKHLVKQLPGKHFKR